MCAAVLSYAVCSVVLHTYDVTKLMHCISEALKYRAASSDHSGYIACVSNPQLADCILSSLCTEQRAVMSSTDVKVDDADPGIHYSGTWITSGDIDPTQEFMQ